jgi:pSer/pThr/pTyr-binding forkhead associated (FHA) protein
MKNFRLKNLTTGNVFNLTQSIITIGRGPFNFVQLNSESLSSQHASIHINNERARIEDLGSTNGTLINNMPVHQSTDLMHGDVITLGSEKLMLIAPGNEDDATVFSLHLGGATSLPASRVAELNAGTLSDDDSNQVVAELVQKVFATKATAKHPTALLISLSKTAVDAVFDLSPATEHANRWAIGRDDTLPIVINNPAVSVNHATIRYEDGKWLIKDNGSTNGTRVNRKRIVESECAHGDIITLGKLNCIFAIAP